MSNPIPATATALPSPRRTFLRQLGAASMMALAATPAMATPADADLIALGERLRTAWQEENATFERYKGILGSDDITDAAAAVSGAIVGEIEAAPATTLEGLKVKALALSWTHCGEVWLIDPPGESTTDTRLAASIVTDLLKMMG